jgi:hypothetical protein
MAPAGEGTAMSEAQSQPISHLEKGATMTEQQSPALEAGSDYDFATDFSLQDGRNGLRYMLLRLSLLGLTAEEQLELRELARLAFSGVSVSEVADRIKGSGASQLAVAIADIAHRAERGAGDRTGVKAALLGAIFGAYGAIRSGRSHGGSEAVLGAVAGAVAMTTHEFLLKEHLNSGWTEFAQRQ